ncbi:MAG: 4Fe-4S dicluster domain-containing protein [Solirubrobacteraceae bacterium]
MSTVVSSTLAEHFHSFGGFDSEVCMSCGVCTAVCPLGIDVLPRQLMRQSVLGLGDLMREESEAIFSCLLCGACEASCPAGVHITDNIRLMRRWLLEEDKR